MNKKRLTICIAEPLMIKFKDACQNNYETMTEALKRFIKEYVEKVKK